MLAIAYANNNCVCEQHIVYGAKGAPTLFQYSPHWLRLPSERKLTFRCQSGHISYWVSLRAAGSITVEVVNNSIAAAVEDPQVVLDLLEADLLVWANDWAATVLPGDNVTIDTTGTT